MPLWPKRKPRPNVDEYGRTALWECAFKGKEQGVLQALAAGADPNIGDDAGYTPLHIAIQERHVSIIELLLKSGANPNSTDKHGNGPLWTAAMNARGDFTIVELLLKAGANPNHKNNYGRSPLDVATTIGCGLEEPFRKAAATQNTNTTS